MSVYHRRDKDNPTQTDDNVELSCRRNPLIEARSSPTPRIAFDSRLAPAMKAICFSEVVGRSPLDWHGACIMEIALDASILPFAKLRPTL